MTNNEQKSTGSDTNGQGVSKPSEGQTQGRTPTKRRVVQRREKQ